MPMIGEAVSSGFFYLFALTSLALAIGVVTSKKILRSAICLMLVLTLSAAFYLLLGAEFIAGIQLLVYVGGIIVLMVFAIMLTGASDNHEAEGRLTRRKLMAAGASIVFFIVVSAGLVSTEFPLAEGATTPLPGAKAIGLSLLSFEKGGYVVPFEVISILLLAALIGGIVIARKEPEEKN